MARSLALADLGPAIPALTEEIGGYLVQACHVCFALKGHGARVLLQVTGQFQENFIIDWPGTITDQLRRAWGDPDDATEQAACGIAVLLIRALTAYTVVERSRKGTGFDYWVGEGGTDDLPPFQRRARLEVSGILEGDDSAVRARVRRKRDQTRLSDGVFPAYVIVVEFSKPGAWVEYKP